MGASGQTQSALPCRPGNSLVAQGEVPSIGNGTMRQVFSLREGFFFALLLIFPLWEAKEPARPSQEAGCHKICFYIDPTGLFFTCRTKKISGAPKPRRHSSPATGMPFCIREKTSGQPTRSAGPAHVQPSPARTDTSSLLTCPLQCEQKNFPKQKQSVREQTTWRVLPLPRGSPSARRMPCRDPPECDRQRCTILFGDKNARGGTSLTGSPPHLSMMT